LVAPAYLAAVVGVSVVTIIDPRPFEIIDGRRDSRRSQSTGGLFSVLLIVGGGI